MNDEETAVEDDGQMHSSEEHDQHYRLKRLKAQQDAAELKPTKKKSKKKTGTSSTE